MISKAIIIGWSLFILYAFIDGVIGAQEVLDPNSGMYTVGVFISLFVHFALWMVVAVPTYILSRMFSRRKSHA